MFPHSRDFKKIVLGAIQVLRNAVEGGVRFPENSMAKVNASTLLALRQGGWV